MIALSIRRKIMGIAIVLIVLMAVTALLSMVSAIQLGNQLAELARSYVPAYGHLARADIRSVERALELRRIVLLKSDRPRMTSLSFAPALTQRVMNSRTKSDRRASLSAPSCKSRPPAIRFRWCDYKPGWMRPSTIPGAILTMTLVACWISSTPATQRRLTIA
ncbi:hypothetical protein ABID59_002155 [Bradyrhizobium sp. S3.3.6]|uniref:hypothetical protein n=1 Tax=Bradyrhizobium sp. S3.3.6 TaxID=3156429 RepID=UPI00339413F7